MKNTSCINQPDLSQEGNATNASWDWILSKAFGPWKTAVNMPGWSTNQSDSAYYGIPNIGGDDLKSMYGYSCNGRDYVRDLFSCR